MYKSSVYNLLIPIPETKETLLYNTFHGGVLALNASQEAILNECIQKEPFELSKDQTNYAYLKTLIDKGYVVQAQLNEFELFEKRKNDKREKMFLREQASIGLTIGTTSNCNMACPYCFEFQKMNYKWDSQMYESLINYIEDMIAKSPHIKKWKELGVNWFGGEPLLGVETIKTLSPQLIALAERYGMSYYCSIITNGTLLTNEKWQTLKECNVTHLQITVDGAKNVHNKHRPLHNSQKRNYEQILENIANMPEDFQLTIRINTDTEVVNHFEEFLDDLETHGIWPQRHTEVHLDPARLYTYSIAQETNTSNRISPDKWEFTRLDLKHKMYEKFNQWATLNNKKKAKFIFKFPRPHMEECICLTSPYVLTVGADGYIYKCWEYIHNKEKKIQHLTDGFDINKYDEYLRYDKIVRCKDSSSCKLLPICTSTCCITTKDEDCHIQHNSYLSEIKNKYLKVLKINGEI